MEYKFLPFNPKHMPSLTALLDESFSIENKDKKALVKWKYYDEYLKNKTVTFIAVDKKENVVGHYSNIPVNISFGTVTYRAMICTDMCTSRDHRGKGLISQLSKRVYGKVARNGFDFSIGYSNDEGVKVDKYANNYGYVIVGRFVRYFKPLILKKQTDLKLTKVSSIEQGFVNQSGRYLTVKKDRNYITWRYFRKPNPDYEIYSIFKETVLMGYVILRFAGIKCYVYDIITDLGSSKFVTHILKSIENESIDKGARIVVYNVLDNSYWKTLFSRYRYFRKTNNSVNYFLTIKLHNQKVRRELILNKDKWLLMNGDVL